MTQKRKFYVVWVGRQPGIYDNWDDCQQQVAMFPGAKFKSYTSQTEATMAFRGNPEEQEGIILSIANHNPGSGVTQIRDIKALTEQFPEINGNAIAVDGACSGNPGVFEYRGVDMSTGQEIFHFGPMAGGTNNIAEYLALVHVLAMLYNRNDHQTPVYTDSRTGRSWVRNRGHRSKLARTPETAPVYQLLERADRWLQTHTTATPILVWDTDRWGEIPADFARK
ncbi:MAG: viroplasmin family protein [Muribaculaceae bacterium]|nr:ribonuclease H family protein [Muribaculaceae bacterium]